MKYLKFLSKSPEFYAPLLLLLLMLSYFYFSGEFKASVIGTIVVSSIWGSACFFLIRGSVKMYKKNWK